MGLEPRGSKAVERRPVVQWKATLEGWNDEKIQRMQSKESPHNDECYVPRFLQQIDHYVLGKSGSGPWSRSLLIQSSGYM